MKDGMKIVICGIATSLFLATRVARMALGGWKPPALMRRSSQ